MLTPRQPSGPSLCLPSLSHSRTGPLIIKSVYLGCSGRLQINFHNTHNRFLFPFTSDNPLDELMKWKEDLGGPFSAQSRIVLLQAHQQAGRRETSSFAVGRRRSFGAHRCTLAIGQTRMKLTVTIGCLASRNASFPSSRLALGAPFPGSSCPPPPCHSPDPPPRLCSIFLLLGSV